MQSNLKTERQIKKKVANSTCHQQGEVDGINEYKILMGKSYTRTHFANLYISKRKKLNYIFNKQCSIVRTVRIRHNIQTRGWTF